MLHIYSLVCFWTWEDFRVLLIIPSFWINLDILTAKSF